MFNFNTNKYIFHAKKIILQKRKMHLLIRIKITEKSQHIANVAFHKIGITIYVGNILNLAVRVISLSCERETILSL